MKKTYETPCADKIAFNYRDQVVAASGDDISGGNRTVFSDACGGDRTYLSGGCDIPNLVAFGFDACGLINA